MVMPNRARFILAALVTVISTAIPAAGQNAPSGELPPLIDRELFFGDPEIAGAQISPDGKYHRRSCKPFKGTRNIWVKRVDEPFEKARAITADTKRPISGYFWSRDGKYVLFVQDQGGDENFNVYAVDPAAAPAAGADVPAARNLTDAKGARAFIYSVPKVNPDVMYVGLNDREPAWHDLYKRHHFDRRAEAAAQEHRAHRRMGVRSGRQAAAGRAQRRQRRYGDPPGRRCRIHEGLHLQRVRVVRTRPFPQGRQADLHADQQGRAGPASPGAVRPGDGQRGAGRVGPAKSASISAGAIFSEVTDELVGTTYTDDRTRVYWRDAALEADYNLLKKQLPGLDVTFASSTRDEKLWIVAANSDVDPGTTYIFDRKTKKLAKQYQLREKLPRTSLAPDEGGPLPLV